MSGIADLRFFNQLSKRSKNRHFIYNDDITAQKYNDIEQIQSAVRDWMDEIEDMRAIDPAVEPEAAGEETKLKGILKATYDRLTASVAACRLSKARLEKDKPWETEESAEDTGEGQDNSSSSSGEEGGFDDLFGTSESESGGEAESSETEEE